MKKALTSKGLPAIALVVLAVVLGLLFTHTNKKAETLNNTSSISKTTKPVGKYAGAVLYKEGDKVTFSAETATLNSAKYADSISSQYGSPVFATAGTHFLILNLTVTNTTDSPYLYQSFALIDQKDRKYDAYSDAIGNIDNYLQGKQLEPNVPLTGVEVYQVPTDSTTFRVGGTVGNSNQIKLIEFTPAN